MPEVTRKGLIVDDAEIKCQFIFFEPLHEITAKIIHDTQILPGYTKYQSKWEFALTRDDSLDNIEESWQCITRFIGLEIVLECISNDHQTVVARLLGKVRAL